MRTLIVSIDGPGGTGKSSVSRAVAGRLGVPYLDTGAFYRAATIAAIEAGASLSDPTAVAAAVEAAGFDQEEGQMSLDGVDVSQRIRDPDIDGAVSVVAAIPEVRKRLVVEQREWADRHGRRAVIEGRDIGSVVFPDADVKIYLDARPEVRAARRARQSGEDRGLVHQELQRRDRIDSTREASPLVVPDGAIVVDTSDLGFDEVVDRVVEIVGRHSA